jgi:hypothetical protein
MSSLKRPGELEAGPAKYMKIETNAEPNNGAKEVRDTGIIASMF